MDISKFLSSYKSKSKKTEHEDDADGDDEPFCINPTIEDEPSLNSGCSFKGPQEQQEINGGDSSSWKDESEKVDEHPQEQAVTQIPLAAQKEKEADDEEDEIEVPKDNEVVAKKREVAPVFKKPLTEETDLINYLEAHQVDTFIVPPEQKLTVAYVSTHLYAGIKTWKDFGFNRPLVRVATEDHTLKNYDVAYQGIPLKKTANIDSPQERLRMEHVCWLRAPRQDPNKSESYIACAYVRTGEAHNDSTFARIPISKLKELFSFVNDIDVAIACNNMIAVAGPNYHEKIRVPFLPHEIYKEKSNNRTRSGGKIDVDVAKTKNADNEAKQASAEKTQAPLVQAPFFNVPTLHSVFVSEHGKKKKMIIPANRVARNINLRLRNSGEDMDFENDKEIAKIEEEELGILMQPDTTDEDIYCRKPDAELNEFIVDDDEHLLELKGRQKVLEEKLEKIKDKGSKDFMRLIEGLDSVKLQIEQQKDENKRKMEASGGRRLDEIKHIIKYHETQTVVSSFLGSRCSWGKYTYFKMSNTPIKFMDMNELRTNTCIVAINHPTNEEEEKSNEVELLNIAVQAHLVACRQQDVSNDLNINLEWEAVASAKAPAAPPSKQKALPAAAPSKQSKAIVKKTVPEDDIEDSDLEGSSSSNERRSKKRKIGRLEDVVKADTTNIIDHQDLMNDRAEKVKNVTKNIETLEAEIKQYDIELLKHAKISEKFKRVVEESIYAANTLKENKNQLDSILQKQIEKKTMLIKEINDHKMAAFNSRKALKERTDGSEDAEVAKAVKGAIDTVGKEKSSHITETREKEKKLNPPKPAPARHSSPQNRDAVIKNYKERIETLRATIDKERIEYAKKKIRKFISEIATKFGGKELVQLDRLVKERNNRVLIGKGVPEKKLNKRAPDYTPNEEMTVARFSLLPKFLNKNKQTMLSDFLASANKDTLKYAANYVAVYDPEFLEITANRIGDRSNIYDLFCDFVKDEGTKASFGFDSKDLLTWVDSAAIEADEKIKNKFQDLKLILAYIFFKNAQILQNRKQRQERNSIANASGDNSKKRKGANDDDDDDDDNNDDDDDDTKHKSKKPAIEHHQASSHRGKHQKDDDDDDDDIERKPVTQASTQKKSGGSASKSRIPTPPPNDSDYSSDTI